METESVIDLHQRFMDGDKAAGWEILQLPEVEQVVASCVARLARRGNREDLKSDLLIVLFESLHNWQSAKGDITSFVATVAQRRTPRIQWRQYGDAKVRREGTSRDATYDLPPEAYIDDGFDRVDEQDNLDLIRDAIATSLTDEEREIIRLRSNSASLDNVAAVRGSSTGTVDRIEKRDIQKIKRAIGDESEFELMNVERSELREHERTIRGLIDSCLDMAVDASFAAGLKIREHIDSLKVRVAGMPADKQALEKSLKRFERETANK